MMKAACVLWLAYLACGRESGAKPIDLVLRDTHGYVYERLTPDGVVTDNGGKVVARFDARTSVMKFELGVPGQSSDVRIGISVRGSREVDVRVGPMVPYRNWVTPEGDLVSSQLSEDGSANNNSARTTVGHLEGFAASQDGAFRLGVLLYALPFVEPPHPPLALLDDKGRLVAQISYDGLLTDHEGHALARLGMKDGRPTGRATLLAPITGGGDKEIDQSEIWVADDGPQHLGVWPRPDLGGPEWLDSNAFQVHVLDTGALVVQRIKQDYPNITPEPGAGQLRSGHLKDYYPTREYTDLLEFMLFILPMAKPHDGSDRLPVEQQPMRVSPPPPPRTQTAGDSR